MSFSAGVGCEVNINECENKPCRNEAVCVDGINEYTCQCLPGYEGTRCQVDIDECNKYSPCQNEAKCIGRRFCPFLFPGAFMRNNKN